MISLRETREFVVECVLTLVSIVSWVALAWAALDMAALLFWPPSPINVALRSVVGAWVRNVGEEVTVCRVVEPRITRLDRA